jgi:hypothetical protein
MKNELLISSLLDERRMGIVKISFALIKQGLSLDVSNKIFSRFFPMEITNSFIENVMICRGVSPEFRALSDGEATPEYYIEVQCNVESSEVIAIFFKEIKEGIK